MKNETNKNILKLQLSTYLEESLSLIGRMMLEDLFTDIEIRTDEEAEEFVEAQYDGNIFELMVPYLELAAQKYSEYKETPEGQDSMKELKEVMEQVKQLQLEDIKTTKPSGNSNEGNGNVH